MVMLTCASNAELSMAAIAAMIRQHYGAARLFYLHEYATAGFVVMAYVPADCVEALTDALIRAKADLVGTVLAKVAIC